MVEQQRLPDWVAWASLTLVFLLVLFMVAGVLRILLDSQLLQRTPRTPADPDRSLTVERAGDARSDARELLGWMLRWLRARLQRAPDGSTRHREADARGLAGVPRAAAVG